MQRVDMSLQPTIKTEHTANTATSEESAESTLLRMEIPSRSVTIAAMTNAARDTTSE